MPSCLRTAPGSGGVHRPPTAPAFSSTPGPGRSSRLVVLLECPASQVERVQNWTVSPPFSHSPLGKRWLHPPLAAASVLGASWPLALRAAQPASWGPAVTHARSRAAAAPPTPPTLPSCSACWCPRLSLRAAWRFWAQHPGRSRWHLARIGHLGLVLTVLSWSPSPQHRSLFGPLSSLGSLLWTQSSFHSPLLHPASVHPRACALTPPRARLGRARVPSARAEPSGRAPGRPLFCGGTAPSSLCEQLSLTGQPAPPHPAQPHLRRCPSWVASALLCGSTQGRARAQGWCGWSPCAAVSWTSCGFQSGRLTGSGFDVPRLQTQQRKDNV